jgi:hypothetical protein
MSKRLLVPIIISLTLASSCKNEEIITFPESITFQNNSFKEIALANPVHIVLDPVIFIYNYHIFDSLLIIRGEIKENSKLLHIYNLNNFQRIVSFAEQGRGPHEYLNVMNFQILHQTNEIFVPDILEQDSRIYSIDSMILSSRKDYSKEVLFEGTKFNGILNIASNVYLCNYCTKFIPEDMMFVSMELPSKKLLSSASYPPLDTSDNSLPRRNFRDVFSNQYSYSSGIGKIVVAYSATDLLEVFDKDLRRTIRIHGPDRFFPKWEITGFSANNLIRGVSRKGFSSPIAVDRGFYVLYSGELWLLDKNLTPENRTVYFFEYSGKPKVRYTFDLGHVGIFRIDQKEDKIIVMDGKGELFLYRIKK